MSINYNVQAMVAHRALSRSENKLSESTRRLSSGYKINEAKDNPSGIAIAKRMSAQLKGLASANQNATDGTSVVQTAEGALLEVQAMIQRMSELSIKAATGTAEDADRELIQEEVKQLKEEIERVAKSTDFNGRKLLNGDADLRGYSSAKGANVKYYSDDLMPGTYKLTINPVFDADGNLQDTTTVDYGVSAPGDDFYRFTSNSALLFSENTLTITDANQNQLKIEVDMNSFADAGTEITFDLTGSGSMRFQIGANEGQVLAVRIPEVSLKNMGIENLDVSTEDSAQAAIEQTKKANAYLASVRSRLGAYQNRLEHTSASLEVSEESVTAAYSRIMDTDMAKEMTEYGKYQVLTQAGTSMLTQANESPQRILQLLQ